MIPSRPNSITTKSPTEILEIGLGISIKGRVKKRISGTLIKTTATN